MKSSKRPGLLFVVGLIMALSMAGCQNRNAQQDNTMAQNLTEKTMADTVSNIVPQNLMVKTIADTASFTGVTLSSGIVSEYEIGAEVDYPTEGPQPLVDSIKKFVIGEMYYMFDWDITGASAQEMIHVPFEQVSEWHGDNIVSVFFNNYAPLYEKEVIGVGADYLNLKLVAQTETFVTYYAEYIDCGASCNFGYSYYTFRKRDGYLLNDIVPNKKWKKYIKVHPQYEVDDDCTATSFGMAKEGLLFGVQIFYSKSDGFDILDTIPYSEIKPYLSKEAQELIQNDN